jgi:hypothetical protein
MPISVAWSRIVTHDDPAEFRTAPKYSNATGRERLRQAASEQ